MNETVVDTDEVMAVIEVVIFMNLSQSMFLRNTKNDNTNEERNFSRSIWIQGHYTK